MPEHRCICGSSYHSEAPYTVHMGTCQEVATRRRRAHEKMIQKSQSSKRRRSSGTNGRSEDGGQSSQSSRRRRLNSDDLSSPRTLIREQGLDDGHALAREVGSSSIPDISHLLPPTLSSASTEPTSPFENDVFPSTTFLPDPEALAMDDMVDDVPPSRIRKPSRRVLDIIANTLPEGPGPLETERDIPRAAEVNIPPPLSIAQRLVVRLPQLVRTLANTFNISRIYRGRPTLVPDQDIGLSDLIVDRGEASDVAPRTIEEIIKPYENIDAFRFNNWHWNGSHKKSKLERKSLLDDVLLQPGFDPNNLRVNFDKIDQALARDTDGPSEGNGWTTDTITINVPTGKKLGNRAERRKKANAAARTARHNAPTDNPDAPNTRIGDPEQVRRFHVPEFRHRSLVHLLRAAIESPVSHAKQYHWHPFEQYWQPPDPTAPPERVYDELYTSDSFINADRELQNTPREPHCNLPRVIAAMMIWSDATHVAQFGTAKLWPIYVYLGNLSKYTRGKPTEKAGYQAGYLPTLPDSFQDFMRSFSGKGASATLLAHCRRELFHEAWKIMLDAEFQEAYKHGIVMDCADGIRRRVYPRIFTYSADYPEKSAMIPGLGTVADNRWRTENARTDDDKRRENIKAARDLIYKKGYAVTSKHVEDLLKGESLVPTENAFSTQLGDDGFNFFLILVVDFMHEFELGIWKSLLSHLIRILHAQGGDLVLVFNERFRQVPSFGTSIRKFPNNVSEMKKLAAHDFEDILQCAIPCFEGLLPSPHNETVLDLLYLTAYVHSLAKLRMHTGSSLEVLDNITIAFGQKMRLFAEETCQQFETYELDKEYAGRARAAARKAATTGKSASAGGRRRRDFNLETSKLHALGDYVRQIRLFGTSDSFTTQIELIQGELQHRLVKAWNERSSKNNAIPQIVNMDVREQAHRRITEDLRALEDAPPPSSEKSIPKRSEPSAEHHHIAKDTRTSIRCYIEDLTKDHCGDPAYEDFYVRLRCHILARIKGLPYDGRTHTFEDNELAQVILQYECIFKHATAAFNYTTYDVRRDQDTISANTTRNTIMTLSHEDPNDDPHPYWYARVIGIYHAMVMYGSGPPKRFEFLHIRWFGRDLEWPSGTAKLRLDRIGYVPPGVDSEPFGFLDPNYVLRACHLIPAFCEGKSADLLGPSSARDFPTGDWINYYVMRFADRDMMMRYLGLGVGHMQPVDFPGEAGALHTVPEDDYTPPEPPAPSAEHDAGGSSAVEPRQSINQGLQSESNGQPENATADMSVTASQDGQPVLAGGEGPGDNEEPEDEDEELEDGDDEDMRSVDEFEEIGEGLGARGSDSDSEMVYEF
ncbi:hypothetical protein HWV62_19591 [Athelia sp. TMB]|nr:hypothetical protein HWV62_19591 [Athelia sp. TMB]